MQGRIASWVLLAAVLSGLVFVPVRGDDWPSLSDWPFHRKADPVGPNSLFQIARSLDAVEEKIRDDGVITTKQPDVWSQDSMTKYRKDFEQQMSSSLGNFSFILSGRVSRSDQASFSSQTALAASLTPLAPSSGSGSSSGGLFKRGGGASTAVTSPTTVIALPSASDVISERNSQQQIANNLLTTPDSTINRAAPFASLLNGKPFQDIGEAANKLGLEPNEYIDQKQSYLEHLNQLRRINLGADNADAAGYGLYLIRVPISVQPGECTYKGHGAAMTVTAKHAFTPEFLPEAFRGFVINDLVDVLTPVIYEMNRSGYIEGLVQRDEYVKTKRAEGALLQRELQQKTADLEAKQAEIARRNAELGSLRVFLAKKVGEMSKKIAATIHETLEDVFKPSPPPAPQAPAFPNLNPPPSPQEQASRKLDTFNNIDRTEKSDAFRQAIEILDQILTVVPRDPESSTIEGVLQPINNIMIISENQQLSLENRDALLNAASILKTHSAGLSSSISQKLLPGIIATPRGKTIMSNLSEIVDAYDALFLHPPQGRKSWNDLFGTKYRFEIPSFIPSAPGPQPPENTSQAQILTQLGTVLGSLIDLVSAQDDLRQAVAQLPAQIAAAQAQVAQMNQQATTPFTRWVATFLPLTRTGTDYYPVAPTDYDDIFLGSNLEGMGRIVYDAKWTKTPRFSDVRSFLRREIEAAYDLLPYYEPFVRTIHEHVIARDFPELKVDYTRLAMALPGELRGQTREILATLCWAIAIDAGLLNRQVVDHVKKMNGHRGFNCPNPESLVFYWHEYLPEAPEPQVFEEIIKRDWPILAFAVDPVINEQNIADASSIHRELQLALAFSFAAGRISFNQLDRFTRRLEYDAETIALNRTISSFTQGKATFGWRFYPRFQNPPPEATNLHVLANLLIKGGQGRNYQMDNSKLEAGQRELTALVVMPSFVPYVKFESTGNWFLLRDPEQLIVPTDRMLKQSQKVAVLRQELQVTEDCGHFREEDLEQLATRIDQVGEILPMQTHRVRVPFSDVSGFELFTPITGSQSLVPLIFGYDGADYIDPTKETDLVLYGKRFSILETQVVAGGQYLTRDPANPETSKMDIISRDVMRVLLPAGLQPTLVRDGKQYVELVVSTPNGVSNRFPIPYGPPSAPQSMPEPLNLDTGYTLMDDLLKLGASVTPANPQQAAGSPAQTTIQTTQTIQVTQGGQPAQAPGQSGQPTAGSGQSSNPPKLTAIAAKVAKGTRIRIMSKTSLAKPSDTIKADFRFPVASSPDTVISVVVDGIPYQNNAFVMDESALNTVFVPDLIAKLDDFGKLTGQNPSHDLTTKTILITSGDSDDAPKATTNQLHVSIELYVQKKIPTTTPAVARGSLLSASVTDGTGRSASASISGTTPNAAATSNQNPVSTPSAPSTALSGSNAPAVPPPPAQLGGHAGMGSGSYSPRSSSIADSSRSARPENAPALIRRDQVVTRAAQVPVIDRPARARPWPGLAGRPSEPASSEPVSGGSSAAPRPAPPRGGARPAPTRTNLTQPSRRPAPRSSVSAARDEPLPPLPSDCRPAPARRSLISRIMGKD